MHALVCIVGPTASGKSAAAVAAAEALGGEVVSCDSVAVYRGLDIGSAKPTALERARVPHHLVDVADPAEQFTAARYEALASAAVAALAARGRLPVVAGGTGLYLRALLEGLFPAPEVDPALRARLAALPLAELRARVAACDPAAAARIGPNDRVRLVRALEVFEQTGVALTELHARARRPPRYRALIVGIDPGRPALYARIDARVHAMVSAGWLDEVRTLIARSGPAAPALESLGYRQLRDHLAGQGTLEETVALVQRDTRRYARRQLSWFRGLGGVAWVPDPAAVAPLARKWLSTLGPGC